MTPGSCGSKGWGQYSVLGGMSTVSPCLVSLLAFRDRYILLYAWGEWEELHT